MRCAVVIAALVLAPAAAGSVWITNAPVHPELSVDPHGNAQVSWRVGSLSQSVIVPAKGQLYHGGSLSGPDVSKPSAVRVPLEVAVRRVGSTLYALQEWSVQPNGPLELHFARWTGPLPPVRLTLSGQRLTGRSPYHGFSTTLEGKRLGIYVFLDYLGPKGWTRMLGVAPHADGSFAVLLRPEWAGRKYRATVAGPGYAPDAQAVANA
jgi:hypothetical protein